MQAQLLTMKCVTWHSRLKIRICLTLIKSTSFEVSVKDSIVVFVFIIQTINPSGVQYNQISYNTDIDIIGLVLSIKVDRLCYNHLVVLLVLLHRYS